MAENKSASIIIQGKNAPIGSFRKTEEYRRSGHTDFMTSKELQDIEFTGIRNNSITNALEVWTVGDLRCSMDLQYAADHPQEWAKLYNKVFSI